MPPTFTPTYARIAGWGKHIPARAVTNVELQERLPTTDEWIVSRTGIRERRIAADTDTPSSLGAQAARNALACAGIGPSDLDLIITATSSPEQIMPATAAIIQRDLGCGPIGAFDVNAACSGGLYALAVAAQFVRSGLYRRVLVVGTEVYSRQLDWDDRSTCILFGDGAGAVVVEASDTPVGILGIHLANYPAGLDLITCRGIINKPAAYAEDRGYLLMNGPAVYKAAVRTMVEASTSAMQQAGFTLDEVDLFIPHQANLRIITAAAAQMALPMDRVFTNVEHYGNTAAASTLIALCEAATAGRLTPGAKLVMAAAGSGLSYAAIAGTWAPNR